MTSQRDRNLKKYYTREEANRALPLVRAIVADIVELARDLMLRQERLKKSGAARKGRPSAAHIEEIEEAKQAWAKDAARLEEFIDELRKLGVELKGWDGLVDFPGWMDDREVCLCWKLGEPEVRFWHEVDAGFAGRQPLPVEPPADQALVLAREE